MTDPRPPYVSAFFDGDAEQIDVHPCPSAATGHGFVQAASAVLSPDAWSDRSIALVEGLRAFRHRVNPRLVLLKLDPDTLASKAPDVPVALPGLRPTRGEIALDPDRRDAVLVLLEGGLVEIANDGGDVRMLRPPVAVGTGFDDPILQAPPPPDPSAFYAAFELDSDVLERARELAVNALGSLEAHGLILRTWNDPDPQAAVRALIAGGDVPSPANHLDGWLADLGSLAVRAYVLRAHARLDAWAEDLDQLDQLDANEPVPTALADHLLVERDGLESLRAVLSRVGERELGARLDAHDPRLRDGPDVAFDAAAERPWLDTIRRDPAAWWGAPLFLASEG